MDEIKVKLKEELDYTIEFSNQKYMYELWNNNDNIKIPKLIPSICNNNLLCMEYIQAESLKTFIEKSTQEERNIIAKYIIEFIFTNFYQNGLFYSDIHYGNFLVKNKKILYVIDFGCINIIEDEKLVLFKLLHNSLLNSDEKKFIEVFTDMGGFSNETSKESKEYCYNYFKLQFEPWTSVEFEFTPEWLEKAVFKDTELMKEWILPMNMIYLNKIIYGLPHILTKLKAKGKFNEIFNNLIIE